MKQKKWFTFKTDKEIGFINGHKVSDAEIQNLQI